MTGVGSGIPGTAWRRSPARGGRCAAGPCALGLLALVALSPLAAAGQSGPTTEAAEPPVRAAGAARVTVGADTIRVGDRVPVVVRVPVSPGERVAWPDTLPLAGSDAESVARVRARVDTLEDGRLEAEGTYAVTPWRTGEVALPELSVGVVAGDESVRTRAVPLPVLQVSSVLPEDTAGIGPRPAKGVVGPSWAWTSVLLVLLVVGALVGGLVWWWRRRRPSEIPAAEPAVDPRERALGRLDAALSAGLLEAGAMKPFYTRVSHAVRGYLADLDPDWGDDLTTTELLGRFRRKVSGTETAALAELLRPADQVKFARREPDAPTARVEWKRARDWVERFGWPPPAPEREEAA